MRGDPFRVVLHPDRFRHMLVTGLLGCKENFLKLNTPPRSSLREIFPYKRPLPRAWLHLKPPCVCEFTPCGWHYPAYKLLSPQTRPNSLGLDFLLNSSAWLPVRVGFFSLLTFSPPSFPRPFPAISVSSVDYFTHFRNPSTLNFGRLFSFVGRRETFFLMRRRSPFRESFRICVLFQVGPTVIVRTSSSLSCGPQVRFCIFLRVIVSTSLFVCSSAVDFRRAACFPHPFSAILPPLRDSLFARSLSPPLLFPPFFGWASDLQPFHGLLWADLVVNWPLGSAPSLVRPLPAHPHKLSLFAV